MYHLTVNHRHSDSHNTITRPTCPCRRCRRAPRSVSARHHTPALHRALQLLLVSRHIATARMAQLHRQSHMGRTLLPARRKSLRHICPPVRLQFLHSGRQPANARQRLPPPFLLAPHTALHNRQHQRRLLHRRDTCHVLAHRVCTCAHMPTVDTHSTRAVGPVHAPACSHIPHHKSHRRQRLHNSVASHRRPLERSIRRTVGRHILGYTEGQHMGRTARKPRLGLGQRPRIPDAALFMLGMLMGRQGWLLESRLKNWAQVLGWALAAYFPLTGLTTLLPGFIDNENIVRPLLLILTSLSKFCFMLVLVSGILYLWYRTRARRTLARIIPYGRMSMTNYVTQSIIGSFIYYNWGLGMHAHLGITASFLLGIALFCAQYLFCRWWMTRHSHGPFEYAWKRLTWI